MDKMLLVSDIHSGCHKDNQIWINLIDRLFLEIADVATRRDISTIAILGDFFDNRKALNVRTLTQSLKIADTLKDFEVFMIVGNHDTYYKNSIEPTSLDIFTKFPNITVIKTPTKFQDVMMIPWNSPIDINRSKYLFGHLEINTFQMNNNFVCTDRYNPSVFSIFDKVVSGHFHIPSTKGNITFLGSAYPQTFADVNSPRGYYIFNDGDLEFLEFTEAPKFVILLSEDNDTSNVEGNIVKLVFQKDYGTNGNNEILEKIQLLKPLQLFTNFSNISLEQNGSADNIVVEIHDIKDTIIKYLKTVNIPEHLKVSLLAKQMFKMIDDIKEDKNV